jgi:hypothetical protein
MWHRTLAAGTAAGVLSITGCGGDEELSPRTRASGLVRTALVLPSSLPRERSIRFSDCRGTRVDVVLLSPTPAGRFGRRLRLLARRNDVVTTLGFSAPGGLRQGAEAALPPKEVERLLKRTDRLCELATSAALLRGRWGDVLKGAGETIEDVLPGS